MQRIWHKIVLINLNGLIKNFCVIWTCPCKREEYVVTVGIYIIGHTFVLVSSITAKEIDIGSKWPSSTRAGTQNPVSSCFVHIAVNQWNILSFYKREPQSYAMYLNKRSAGRSFMAWCFISIWQHLIVCSRHVRSHTQVIYDYRVPCCMLGQLNAVCGTDYLMTGVRFSLSDVHILLLNIDIWDKHNK